MCFLFECSVLKVIEMINKTSIGDNSLLNRQDFTLTHLESQINAAIGLNSAKEYKFWLMTYARYLTENGEAVFILYIKLTELK